MQRMIVRGLLILAFLAAVSAVVLALAFPMLLRPEALAVVAAALAIIPAVLATWSGQRMVELEEDSKVAFPYPTFDAHSRYTVLQLRISNFGNSIARNVYLEWTKSFEVSKGGPPTFLIEAAPLHVLLPNESASFYVDGSHDFVKKYGHAEFTGIVHFENASGRKRSHPFVLSSSKFKDSLTFDEESPKTHHELQKLPKHLHDIGKSVKEISRSLGRSTEITPVVDDEERQE